MRGLKPQSAIIDIPVETSHLLQMRGLKHLYYLEQSHFQVSHLLQMRGLKLTGEGDMLNPAVASFTDAWIETERKESVIKRGAGRIFYRCVD